MVKAMKADAAVAAMKAMKATMKAMKADAAVAAMKAGKVAPKAKKAMKTMKATPKIVGDVPTGFRPFVEDCVYCRRHRKLSLLCSGQCSRKVRCWHCGRMRLGVSV